MCYVLLRKKNINERVIIGIYLISVPTFSPVFIFSLLKIKQNKSFSCLNYQPTWFLYVLTNTASRVNFRLTYKCSIFKKIVTEFNGININFRLLVM